MSIDCLKNLLFQKKEFPEIYNSYDIDFDNTVHADFVFKNDLKYLYILVDEGCNFSDLIEGLFYVRFDFNEYVDTCIIEYYYDNNSKEIEDDYGGTVVLKAYHPFLKQNTPVLFSRTLNDHFLQKTNLFATYKSEPLKQLQTLKIQRYFTYLYEQDNIKSIIELKNCIKDYNPEYKLSFSVKKPKKRIRFNGTSSAERMSLEIIKILNDGWNDSEKLLIEKCVEVSSRSFELCAKEILNTNLQKGCFDDNFICIEKYFVFLSRIKKNTYMYFEKNIIPSVKKYKEQVKDYVVIHNLLSSDKGILGLDVFIQEGLEQLSNMLEV